MTPRERWLATQAGRRPDRPACDYSATAEVTRRFMRDLGCAGERELWEHLGVDACIRLAPVHPKARERGWHVPSLYTSGMSKPGRWLTATGSGNARRTTSTRWPKPARWRRLNASTGPTPGFSMWKACAPNAWRGRIIPFSARAPNRSICIAACAAWNSILERIFEFDYARMRHTLTELSGLIDLVCVAEDLGTQESLLMSPRAFRRFLKPHMAKLIELAHSASVKVFHHDDCKGYIVAPCHNLQPNTPTANILALYEAVRES